MTHEGAERAGPEPRRARGLAVALLLPLGLLAATVWGLGLPVARFGEARAGPGVAAVAVRDFVHPVEKLGTWALVEPRLERAYAEVRTVTQGHRGSWDAAAIERFRSALGELAARYERVDVFLLSHTNYYVKGAAELDLEPGRLGLVYDSGCRSSLQRDAWLELGAAAHVSHPRVASHAAFAVFFLERWLAGDPLARAVEGANASADRFFAATGPLWPASQERWLRSHARIAGREGLAIVEGER